MKRSSLLACLLALCLVFLSAQSQALTLGRLRVLSPLGQALSAEIDIADISTEEANSLRIAVAAPDTFKSAGLEYNPAIVNITILGKRRPDGRAYLELRNTSAITDPFLDLVLDISWATGRMVRDYTLLFDPHVGNISAANALPSPALPLGNTTPIAATTSAAPISPTAISSLAPISASTLVNPVGGATPSGATPATGNISARTARSASATKNGAKQKLKVKKGDTAAALAAADKPDSVSLDQMLVAMLKLNPDAFVDGNVNRLKSGVLLEMPSEAEAKAISNREAKSSLQVQSRDFNEYRRNLASHAANTGSEATKRETSGKVTAKVEDKKSSALPDRLTLAKPDATNKPSAEDKIAKDRAANDAAGRKAELEKNISDLGKIAAPALPALPVSPLPPVPLQTETPPALAPALTASEAPAVVSPASPASSPAASIKASSWINQLMAHPLTLWIAAGIALLLLLIAAWVRIQQRSRVTDTLLGDSTKSFAPTQQATQTVFGAMGANQVDTQESLSSTMVYSPSQFAAGAGDVDPIAEADVYLAYNRDVQAEEILKEAKRSTPKRTDVYVKLLEIYVKRNDTESFDATAQELHLICDGEGTDWSRTRELAREIRSSSALFAVSGSSFAASEVPQNQSAYASNSLSFTPSVQLHQPVHVPTSTAPTADASHLIDFDLSALTLDLPPPAPTYMAPTTTMQTSLENAKLALAEEYLAIGDKAGARGLIHEVIAQESNPDVLKLAHQMLGRIG